MRKIERLTGRSRKTVSKYVREDERLNRELLKLDEGSVEIHEVMEKIAGKPESKAKYQKRPRRKFTPEIEREVVKILEDEKRKAEEYGEGHKIKRTAKDIHEILEEKGYDISYQTVAMHLKRMREDDAPKQAFIKQQYNPGQRAEFDFGERKVTIGGKKQKVYIAALCSAATNYRDFYVYPTQKSEVFVDAMVRFIQRTGVFDTFVFDNMKNVVKRFVGKNKRELTDTVLRLSNYYGFEIVLTNPYSGNEKGSIEISVRKICHDLFANKDQFESWADLIDHVREVKKKMNKDIDIQEERKCLDTSKKPFESAVVNERKVSKYSFIRDDYHEYSVPAAHVGSFVTVKRYPHTIEVFSGGALIARHKRNYGGSGCSVKIDHYLDTMLRKPGALANSVALRQAPKLKDLFINNYSENPREFLETLMDHKDMLDTEELYELLERGGHSAAPTSKNDKIEKESRHQLDSLSRLF